MKPRIMFGKFKTKNNNRQRKEPYRGTVLPMPKIGKIHKSATSLTAFLPFFLPMSDISSVT